MKNATKRRIFGRRGIVDVQFNWIFILIAGVVILLFIISIVLSQKRNADVKTDISAMSQITTLLKSKQQTADVYSEITIPSTVMNFRCDKNEKYFSYKISNSGRVVLPTEIIFTPQEIISNRIQVWSQAFDVGFPVGIFIYMTTPNSIIIVYNGTTNSCPYARQLYDSLPSNISKNITNNPLPYISVKNKKIVCFNAVGCGCPSPANYDYINITPIGGLFGYGNVTFHSKNGINNNIIKPYLMSSGLYGAIFSDSAEYYDCQMSRVLSQFEVKRLLVEKRLEMMQEDMGPSECSLKLKVALDDEIIPMANLSLNITNVKQMYITANDLDIIDADLTLSSCPKIY